MKMSKKNELMLALWPTSNQRNYWQLQDTSKSMWLSLRSVEITREEGVETYYLNSYETDGVACRSVGLWVWSSAGFSSCVELKAHNVYSANAWELTQLAKWLTKMNNKIAKADIPDSFGVKEKLILTLRAMGVRRSVEIAEDWRSPNGYKVAAIEDGLALQNYAGPLAEMEELRKQEYRSVA
jgi:hypothetical protein